MNRTTRHVLRDGLAAGLAGYLAVAVLFLVANLAQGRPAWYTPAVMGQAFFGGVTDGSVSVVQPVIAFNGAHLLVSLLLGTAAAGALAAVERLHSIWYLALFLVIGGVLLGTAMVGAVAAEARPLLAWTDVVAGNMVGAAATVGTLLLLHRKLGGEVARESAAGTD